MSSIYETLGLPVDKSLLQVDRTLGDTGYTIHVRRSPLVHAMPVDACRILQEFVDDCYFQGLVLTNGQCGPRTVPIHCIHQLWDSVVLNEEASIIYECRLKG